MEGWIKKERDKLNEVDRGETVVSYGSEKKIKLQGGEEWMELRFLGKDGEDKKEKGGGRRC